MKVDMVSSLAPGSISPNKGVGSPRASHVQQTGGSDPVGVSASGANVQTKPTGTVSGHGGLTNAERAFFAKLFPDSKSQINAHATTYSPGGNRSPVELGQIINRKV